MSLLNVFSVRIVFRFKLFADFFIDIAPLTFYVKQNSGFYSTFSFNVKYICSCSLSQNTFTLINKSNNTIRTSFCGAWLFLFSPLSQIEVWCFPFHFLQIYFGGHVLRVCPDFKI